MSQSELKAQAREFVIDALTASSGKAPSRKTVEVAASKIVKAIEPVTRASYVAKSSND